jgi:phosphatidylglycerol lysyltransferase
MNKKLALKIGKIIIMILLFAFVLFELIKEIKSIDFAKTILLIRSFNAFIIILFLLFGLFSNFLMTLYDFIIVKHLKLDIKKLFIFNISFIANSINSISGLGGLTGASIRAVFFKKGGNESDDIVKYGLLLVPATGVGLSVLALISSVNYIYIKPIMTQNKWLLILMYSYIAYLIAYFFIDTIYYKIKEKQYKGLDPEILVVKTKLLFVSFLEWFSAYLLFALIIRQFDTGINYYIILGIYSIASVAGIVSMLPGGAGSFDLLVLLGFKIYGLSTEHTVAAIILFRTFYYFIPLTAAIIFSIIIQLKNGNSPLNISNIKIVKGFIDKSSTVTNILLMLLIFLSGLVLLISGMVPGIAERLKLAGELLSFPIMQWSHQLSICIGTLLIIMSIKIGMKEKRAYKATLYLLVIGAISTFLKGFDYEEAIFLIVVFLLLKISKTSFYRKSLPFNWFNTSINMILLLILIIIYAALKHLIFMDFIVKYHFSAILIKSTIVSHYNVIIAYTSLILFVIIWEVTKPKIENDKRFITDVDEGKFNDFLNIYGGNFLTHLIYLNDKNIYWASENKTAIIYQKSHNIMVVLGDIIGDEKYFRDGITEFQSFLDEYGYKAAFYEVGDTLLPLYHDFGYDFFKLGETALIDLEGFDLVGPDNRDFRNVMSRFKRDGYVFEFFNSLPDELLDTLKNISDEWLNGRKEMGFSLGSFNEKYLKHSPIAIIKHEISNEIIAFASLMPSYDKNQSISMDLMRFKKEVPNNTMTFLILNLLIKFKEDGYKIFNLGMSPLSNVGETQKAHLAEKTANIFMRHGSRFYSFEGLRKYKNKFNPKWEARYLAYEDITALPSSLIEATLLIHSDKDDS